MKIFKNILLLALSTLLLTGCSAIPGLEQILGTQVKTGQTTVASGELQVTFLDVGQGDCTIVQTEGYNMMIDAGDNGEGEHVVSYLMDHGIERLDYLVLTHPDADHIGGADDVIEHVSVDRVIMPDVKNDTATYEDVINDIQDYNIEVIYPDIGEVYTLGDAEFRILCPLEVSESDLNGSSVGIKLVHGSKSFVMCGDAEEKAEAAMVQMDDDLECDVLKCGHHGSKTATADAFLEATDPTWAVISCGKGNRYGHPHSEVLAKLENEDVQVYRTDELGTVSATSDGENITWSSEK